MYTYIIYNKTGHVYKNGTIIDPKMIKSGQKRQMVNKQMGQIV